MAFGTPTLSRCGLIGAALFILFSLSVGLQAQSEPVLPPAQGDKLKILTHLRHHSPVTEGFFSPQGSVFVTGTLDGGLHFWQAAENPAFQQGAERFRLADYLLGVTRLVFDAQESRFAANLGGDGLALAVYDARTGDFMTDFPPLPAPPQDLRWLAEVIVVHDFLDGLTFLDVQASAVLGRVEVALALTTSSRTGAVAWLDENRTAWLAESAAPDSAQALPAPNEAWRGLAFSPGGRYLAAWGAALAVYDVQAEAWLFVGEALPIESAVWTADSRFILTSHFEGGRVWALDAPAEGDKAPRAPVDTFEVSAGQAGLKQLALAPDGTRLVTVDRTDGARLWQLTPTGDARQIRALQSITDSVLISPDSLTLLSFQREFPVRFWDLRSGDLYTELVLPEALLFSPDWRLIASYQGTLVTWRGLPRRENTFAYTPLGRPSRRALFYAEPDTASPRLFGLDADREIFAVGRSADSVWIEALFEDDTRAWVQKAELVIGDPAALEALPVTD